MKLLFLYIKKYAICLRYLFCPELSTSVNHFISFCFPSSRQMMWCKNYEEKLEERKRKVKQYRLSFTKSNLEQTQPNDMPQVRNFFFVVNYYSWDPPHLGWRQRKESCLLSRSVSLHHSWYVFFSFVFLRQFYFCGLLNMFFFIISVKLKCWYVFSVCSWSDCACYS